LLRDSLRYLAAHENILLHLPVLQSVNECIGYLLLDVVLR
jgi:hypothetical protein